MSDDENVRFSRRKGIIAKLLEEDDDNDVPLPSPKNRPPKKSVSLDGTKNFKEKENKKCWQKNSMSSKLTEFLHQHRVQKILPHTHTSMDPSGCYSIKGKDLDVFWELFSQHVFDLNLPITLTEKPMGITPLRFDFDYKQKLTKRQYNLKILKKIVKILQDILREIVDADVLTEDMLYCIVLEKSAPRVDTKNNCYKDGFHIHFPFFFTEAWVADEMIRIIAGERMIRESVWSDCDIEGSPASFIDKNISTKTWLMFGSSKDLEAEPYTYDKDSRLGYAFDESQNEIDLSDIFEDADLPRDLPKLLSIRFTLDKGVPLNKNALSSRKKYDASSRPKAKRQITNHRPEEMVWKDYKIITESRMLDYLNDETADDRDDWMQIGWALFCIGEGREEFLDLWKDFSRRSPKYDEGDCDNIWNTMSNRGKTIGSLFAYFKRDSPKEYEEYRNNCIRGKIEACLRDKKPSDYDLSQLIVARYKDRFLCSNAKKEEWYEYKGHRWVEMDDCSTLWKLIPTDIKQLFIDYNEELGRAIARAEDEDDSDMLLARQKKVNEAIVAVKTSATITKMINMAKHWLLDENFEKKKDENRKLFGLPNGVLDYEMMTFRDGCPEDYITMQADVEYEAFEEDDPRYMELMDYLEKVFPDEKVKNYFLDFLAVTMFGPIKKALIPTGTGDNSKSLSMALLKELAGDYMYGFPQTTFTEGAMKSAGGHRSDITGCRGARWATCPELTKRDRLAIGEVKRMTGNDIISERGAYDKKNTIFQPMFTLIIPCNDPPVLPVNDPALFNRIRLMVYEAKFDNKAPEDEEEQRRLNHYPADDELPYRIPIMSKVLLYELFKRACEIKKTHRKIIEPKKVVMATHDYQSEFDMISSFIKDNYVRVPSVFEKYADKEELINGTKITKDKTAVSISLVKVSKDFEDWYKKNYPSIAKNRPGQNELKKELTKRNMLMHESKRKFYGWKFREYDDDEEEEEEDYDEENDYRFAKESVSSHDEEDDE